MTIPRLAAIATNCNRVIGLVDRCTFVEAPRLLVRSKLKYFRDWFEKGAASSEGMNEALFYPFAPKRDLIDASSRIYDMNASAPVQNEGRLAEPAFGSRSTDRVR